MLVNFNLQLFDFFFVFVDEGEDFCFGWNVWFDDEVVFKVVGGEGKFEIRGYFEFFQVYYVGRIMRNLQ